MGLLQWIKKEIDSTHFSRRQSAPPKSLRSLDPNRSRDEAYILAMNKFMEYRQNERRKLRPNDELTTHISNNSDKRSQQKIYRDIIDDRTYTSDELKRFDYRNGTKLTQTAELNTLPGHRSNSSSNQSTIEKINSNFSRQNSLPANMSKNYIVKAYRKKKGKAPQPSKKTDRSIIHEDEIRAFEGNHCQMGSTEISDSSNIISPPARFYKLNSNPFPAPVENGNFGTYQADSHVSICPAKPKRLLLKQQDVQKNTKELVEAHFNGAYKDYEFHNGFYDGKDRDVLAEELKRFSPEGETSSSGRYSPQYQTIINKHGQMVEYAVPYCEQQSINPFGEQQSMQLEDEVFEQDPNVCEKIVGGTYRLNRKANGESHNLRETGNSRNNLYTKRARKQNEHILVTDLDKSIDSSNMMDDKRQSHDILDELNSLSKWSENITKNIDPKSKSQNELLELICAVKSSMPCCRTKELTRKTSVLQNTFPSPVEIVSGVFRQTTVTLRNYPYPNIQHVREESLLIAGEAIKRDYDILRQIRHRGIIMLMAVSFDLDYKNITLILEPADYTLHYFLHQMNEKPSLLELISIVQQIASAALYLHECGYIHSNISSHCILMSRSPHCVKLSSFELATSVSSGIQHEIESKYRRHSNRVDEGLTNIPIYALLMRNNDKLLKTHYRDMSKHMARDLNSSNYYSIQCLSDVEPQYLPYYVEYRRQLSVYNYQAPELLTTTERFVYPTRRSDVYSLSLLLWELLNYSVPFAIFNETELKRLYRENKAELKIFEERRCKYFKQILKYGTANDPVTRSMTLEHFISLLEDIKFEFDSEKYNQTQTINHIQCTQLSDDMEIGQTITRPNLATTNSESEDEQNENIYENTEDIMNDIDAQLISPEIMNEVERGFKKKPITPPVSPLPKNDKILSPLNNITDSTIYRSIGDFKKVLSPLRACNRLIERNSTLKKRKKPQQSNSTSPKAAMNITACGDLLNMSTNLNENIVNGHDVHDQHVSAVEADVFEPQQAREVQLPSRNIIKRQQTKYMDRMLNDENATGVDNNDTRCSNKSNGRSNPMIVSVTPKRQKLTTDSDENGASEEACNSSMGIALKNKIRRNAWLSQNTPTKSPPSIPTPPKEVPVLPIVPVVPVVPTSSLDPSIETLKNAFIESANHILNGISPSSFESFEAIDAAVPANKKVNVSIKIVHKNVTPDRTDICNKSQCADISGSVVNTDESPSVSARIKFWNSLKTPIITPKQNNQSQQQQVEFSATQTSELPEVIEIIIPAPRLDNEHIEFNEFSSKINQAQQWFKTFHGEQNDNHNKSLANSIEHTQLNRIEESIGDVMEIRGKVIGESDVENEANVMAQPPKMDIVPLQTSERKDPIQPVVDSQAKKGNKTMIKRTYYKESIVTGTDVEVPELERMLDTKSTSVSHVSSGNKLTTRVTLNMHNFQRRSSDFGLKGREDESRQSPRMTETRHSISGNDFPYIKQLQGDTATTVVTTSGRSLQEFLNRPNKPKTCTCVPSALLSQQSINCTSTDMLMATGDILSSVRRINVNKNIQSIEDLYIDDDFCSGMCLAANMKLVTNSNDTLGMDNINFDGLTSQISEAFGESGHNSRSHQNKYQKSLSEFYK